MKNIALISFAILSVFLLSGCDKKENWSLFIYPYGNPSEKSINTINAYSSFEECSNGFEFNKKSFPKASFECGYKCKTQDIELGLYICEDTRDN